MKLITSKLLLIVFGLSIALPTFAEEPEVSEEKKPLLIPKNLKLKPAKSTQPKKEPQLTKQGIQKLMGKVQVSLNRGTFTYSVARDDFMKACQQAKIFIKNTDGKLAKLPMVFSKEGGGMGTKARYFCRSKVLTQPLNQDIHFVGSLVGDKYFMKLTSEKARLKLDTLTKVNFIFNRKKATKK